MTRYELQPAGPSLGRVCDLLVTLSRGSSPCWQPPWNVIRADGLGLDDAPKLCDERGRALEVVHQCRVHASSSDRDPSLTARFVNKWSPHMGGYPMAFPASAKAIWKTRGSRPPEQNVETRNDPRPAVTTKEF